MAFENKIAQFSREKIPVGVSSCLLGEKVRYDGGHKRSDYIVETLGEHFDLQAFCPEMAAGLGVPRPPVRLLATDAGLRAVGVNDPSLDVSDALKACAEDNKVWHSSLCGYILKKGSPSCGMERVKTYRPDCEQPERNGIGLYADALMRNFPALPVEDEDRLGDLKLRESFVRRVHMMHLWQQMIAEGLSKDALAEFHGCHKLMFENKSEIHGLDVLIAQCENKLRETAQAYILRVMALLKLISLRGPNV